MGETRRDLLAVVGHQHHGGLPGSAANTPSRDTRRSRAPRSRPAAGSSSRSSSGSAHERAGQEHLLTLALGDHPERARRRSPRIQSRRASDRLPPSPRPSTVPPRFERTVATADHDVACREVGPELTGDRTAHQCDARAQRPDVDPAEARAENLHASRRRPQPGTGQLSTASSSRIRWGRGSPTALRVRRDQSTSSRTTVPVAAYADPVEVDHRRRDRRPASTRRGSMTCADAPAHPADEARAALGPHPLAGQPEPDLTAVPDHDIARTRPRQADRAQACSSGTTATGPTRRRRAARRSGHRRRGRRPTRPRHERWARRARAAWGARSPSMADEDGLAVGCPS